MAKNQDEEDQTEDEGAAENAGAGKKKRLVTFAAAGALALLLAGGGGYFFLAGGDSSESDAEAAKPVVFVDMREMIVNLAFEPPQERPRFLKFRVSLELDDPRAVAAIEPLMPRIEDAFQVYLRELRPSELDGSAGVHRLREELLRRVNIAVHPAKVNALLFQEVVVQ
ncbi:MAG: flagellar basal body-associated protein FliL [Salinarimonadaceae bacterium]|nr:MAG: flagellar basal body-associated protein FliL [Salinarimonadaceae bacterium]